MPKWFQFLGWILILSAFWYVADLTKNSLVYAVFFISIIFLFASVYGIIFAIIAMTPVPDKATLIVTIILLLGTPFLAYIIVTLIATVVSALTAQFNPTCLC